ncbi:MAG TPA: L,D-transpeptidase family protein [Ensifer sp.]|jgi:murein L,D-transpeptidase YafK|uniref:L,D-transpeptidase family protein n=1 Tax=Ensifer sp. TaxID=1872086 RepID=UPI002E129DF9|nr:L,D-transpeptidase family protein [Ensifer sp.]
MRLALVVAALVVSGGLPAAATDNADRVVVHKERRLLQLFQGGQVIREYTVALGGNPTGHKRQEGDERTPEGLYSLDWRNPGSGYHKSIHVSYPAQADVAAAAASGIDPGGMIMIHGQPNYFGWLAFLMQRFDWTNGCIAVTNAQMDEIWTMVPNNTPIEIRP